MTTQEQAPSPDDLRRAALKRAIDTYDFQPIMQAWLSDETFGLLEDRDTRIVQARLKEAVTQRDYLLAEADRHYLAGRTMRAGELTFYASLHHDNVVRITAYLKAIGADSEVFMARQPAMFEVAAA